MNTLVTVLVNRKEYSIHTKTFIAEFIGTFTLIFVGVGAIAGNYLNGGQTGLVGIALAHGHNVSAALPPPRY